MRSLLEDRLREASSVADLKGGFTIQVLPTGIRIKLVREYPPGEWNPLPRHFVFENFTGWTSITEARINLLLTCIRDLSKQADEYKP